MAEEANLGPGPPCRVARNHFTARPARATRAAPSGRARTQLPNVRGKQELHHPLLVNAAAVSEVPLPLMRRPGSNIEGLQKVFLIPAAQDYRACGIACAILKAKPVPPAHRGRESAGSARETWIFIPPWIVGSRLQAGFRPRRFDATDHRTCWAPHHPHSQGAPRRQTYPGMARGSAKPTSLTVRSRAVVEQ